MAATQDVDISSKQLESVKGYIAMLLNLKAEDLDSDDDDEDEQVVTEVTVEEVAKNTLPSESAVRGVLAKMAREPGTGVTHEGGDTYEIEPRE